MQDLQGPHWGCLCSPRTLIHSRNNAQWLCHLGKNVRRSQQLVALVRCADDGPKPCFPLSDHRVTNRRGKNSRFKKLRRKFKRLRGISNVNGNDRRLAALELKAALLQFALEELRVCPQFLH